MTFSRLLAKSSRTPDTPDHLETLAGHLSTVTAVAALVAERWGMQHLATLGLDPERFLPRLRVALPRAAFAHDLGKGSDHFQRMVRRNRSATAQAGLHEQLSVWLLLRCDHLGGWLFQDHDVSLRHAVLAAVLGHHLRVEDAAEIRLREGAGALRLVILCGHPDFKAVLKAGSALLSLLHPPVLADVTLDLLTPEEFDGPMHRWVREASAWWRMATEEERRFVAALKALLVASDVAGSAVLRMRADAGEWARRALEHVCSPVDLEQVVALRLRGASPRPFQRAVQNSAGRVAFVAAGCGSGKTAAAYLWAGQKADGRKLFFCYPTTGTASQGFADYVPPDLVDAALVHSRASADLEDLLTDGTEGTDKRLDWFIRFNSLAAWEAPITVCTVDTVLGLIQNNRQGLYSFPAIANGTFVFDEVHQYDDRLFGVLLRFLDTFRGAPTLLMTASLPRARLTALQDAVARLGECLDIIQGPAELEALKRYRIEPAEPGIAWDRVAAVVKNGGRVLWVANTVDRAVDVADQAEKSGLPVLPYHSRYRYQDRLNRHRDIVATFAGRDATGLLAATTQVCEVSLDLSADLLVTELAPIPALIQRLGRLNRRVTPKSLAEPAPALVLEPPRPAPYRAAEMEDARRWIHLLGTGPISQADLATAFDNLLGDVPIPESSARSAWLDGGALTGRAALREEGTTIPVVREEDVGRLRGLTPARVGVEIIRLTIPMPLGPVARDIGSWNRVRGALVAPAGRMGYSERLGGCWR